MKNSNLTFLILSLLAAVTLPLSADTLEARGRVILDNDGTGQPSATNPGIPGVIVSSLAGLTRTDAEGRFSLPINAARDTIFVIRPADTRYPVNAHQLPQFFHHHQPAGTPAELNFRYRGIDPTGPLPEETIFTLLPAEKEESFTVIALTDTQAMNDRELDYLRDSIVRPLLGTDAAFLLNTGDLLFDELSLFPRLNALIGSIGVPVFTNAGNHDFNFESPGREDSFETFRRIFGPTYYAFFHGQVAFIALDNVNYHGYNQGDYQFRTRGQGTYSGEIDEVQLKWLRALEAEIPEDHLIVFYSHIPLRTTRSDGPSNNTTNLDALLEIFAGRPAIYALAGHTHTMEHIHLNPSHGWTSEGTFHQQILSGASGAWFSGPRNPDGIPYSFQIDGTPPGYYLIHFDGTRYHPVFHPAAHHPRDMMRIHLDTDFMDRDDWPLAHRRAGEMGRTFETGIFQFLPLYANVFDGCDQTTVHFRLGSGEWQPMEQIFDIDPWMWLYREFSNRHRTALQHRSVNAPVKTPHLWRGNFPGDLTPGVHGVEVRAERPDGTTWTQTQVIEVTGQK